MVGKTQARPSGQMESHASWCASVRFNELPCQKVICGFAEFPKPRAIERERMRPFRIGIHQHQEVILSVG
jgi:hypothetical protein